jgi:hypothetical protein
LRDQDDLAQGATRVNDRPRRVLGASLIFVDDRNGGWRTPAEVFADAVTDPPP